MAENKKDEPKLVKLTSPAGTKVTVEDGDLVKSLKAQGWK
jgi:hypothetical protein